MTNKLNQQIRFQLMKEFDNYVKSPRKMNLTSEEFRKEASRELGCEFTLRHIEGCAHSFGMKISDAFKLQSSNSARPSLTEFRQLEHRVAMLEEKLKGL